MLIACNIQNIEAVIVVSLVKGSALRYSVRLAPARSKQSGSAFYLSRFRIAERMIFGKSRYLMPISFVSLLCMNMKHAK